jgi:hypothetical protein
MKLTLKIFLVVSLFSSIAFADDGDMSGGNKTCPPGQTCFTEGDMSGGNRAVNDQDQNDSVLTFIQKYLGSIFE